MVHGAYIVSHSFNSTKTNCDKSLLHLHYEVKILINWLQLAVRIGCWDFLLRS